MSHSLAPPRRRPKRVLAVRMLVARVAWLDGQPRWQEGRVVWTGPHGHTAPDPAELARAQRCLYKIRRYPFASASALGDSRAWLAERQSRLELAKQLCQLSAPDLPTLAAKAHQGDRQAIQRMVSLLPAEACCVNALPVEPSAVLLTCGERATGLLRTLLFDEGVPSSGRALAALTLGAIERQTASPERHGSSSALDEAWLRRAYQHGLQAGLPPAPGLMVTLLHEERGADLARRAGQVLSTDSPFRLPEELLRELLAGDLSADGVVAAAEAAIEAGRPAERALQRRGKLPDRPPADRRAAAERLAQLRQQTVAALNDLLHAYLRNTLDPGVVRRILQFAGMMLDMGALSEELSEAILQPLRSGLKLAPPTQRPFLELLIERHSLIWDRPTVPPDTRPDRLSRRLGSWLHMRSCQEVRPLLKLLEVTVDVEVARTAHDLGLHRVLSFYEWRDPDLYSWLLSLARDVCPPDDSSLFDQLCDTVDRFPSASTARAGLQPLLQAVKPAPPGPRTHFLEAVLFEIPRTREGLRDALTRLIPYVPSLLRFSEQDDRGHCLCGALVAAALAIDRSISGQAGDWLAWMLAHLAELARVREQPDEEENSVRIGFSLALVLAEGDFPRFQAVVRTALLHPIRQERETLESSLSVLRRYPALIEPLARLFPQQPHRCAELLVRLGMTAHLGRDVLWPLDALGTPGDEEEMPSSPDGPSSSSEHHDDVRQLPGWSDLLDLTPDLSAAVLAYRRSQELLRGSLALPRGVRRSLDLPRRLEMELSHLEQLQKARPERHDLCVRAGNLRARLGNMPRLMEEVREEVRKRLVQVAAEAQIAAAEQQVLACYRARLESLVGPLPADLPMDADLVNAVLLSVRITRNRRLLVRLLRAHLAGDHRWREQHPANSAFLAELAARGVDTDAWLAVHPRRYRCPSAQGGWVHLRLEKDPLRILQMGNHFKTCLSFDQCNAFSTVANACELNKRVVYATDGAGHVVGRKLIAINREGGLIGFYTYTSLSDGATNETLRAIFRHYLRDFAARCGLALADSGTVPLLFAQDWYDDGIIGWDEEEPPAAIKPPLSRSPCTP